MKERSFYAGDRIELSPTCPEWQQGERAGTVTRTNLQGFVFVRLDKSGAVRRFSPEHVRAAVAIVKHGR